jgi:hypothetical protein
MCPGWRPENVEKGKHKELDLCRRQKTSKEKWSVGPKLKGNLNIEALENWELIRIN